MRTHHTYDKAVQRELLTSSDWETKRADEFPDAVFWLSMVAALLFFGYTLLNSIADWVVGL